MTEKILTGLSYLVMIGPFFMKETYDFIERNVIMNAVYISFVRVVWALAIAWIIFTCHNNLNKNLNTFLSSKYWMLISRIGFSIYLIHPVLQFNLAVLHSQQISLDFFSMVINDEYFNN